MQFLSFNGNATVFCKCTITRNATFMMYFYCQLKYKNLENNCFVNLYSTASFLCIFAFKTNSFFFLIKFLVAFILLSMPVLFSITLQCIFNGAGVLFWKVFSLFFRQALFSCHFLINKTDCEEHLFVYMLDFVLLGRKCDFLLK